MIQQSPPTYEEIKDGGIDDIQNGLVLVEGRSLSDWVAEPNRIVRRLPICSVKIWKAKVCNKFHCRSSFCLVVIYFLFFFITYNLVFK